MQFRQLIVLPFLALAAAVANAAEVPRDYPYVKPTDPTVGIQIGPGAGIAMPAWLLMLIFFAFVGVAGMLVMKLLAIPKERELAEEKKRQAKLEKKNKKKKSLKAQ